MEYESTSYDIKGGVSTIEVRCAVLCTVGNGQFPIAIQSSLVHTKD